MQLSSAKLDGTVHDDRKYINADEMNLTDEPRNASLRRCDTLISVLNAKKPIPGVHVQSSNHMGVLAFCVTLSSLLPLLLPMVPLPSPTPGDVTPYCVMRQFGCNQGIH